MKKARWFSSAQKGKTVRENCQPAGEFLRKKGRLRTEKPLSNTFQTPFSFRSTAF
jgi:hypothetical protein